MTGAPEMRAVRNKSSATDIGMSGVNAFTSARHHFLNPEFIGQFFYPGNIFSFFVCYRPALQFSS
jgi:hypothetical protein